MSETKAQLEKIFEEEKELFLKTDENVLKEINYSRKQLELDLVELKKWLKDQHHLPECRLTESDNFLGVYLTGCKGSMETVKRKLDAYYTLRGKSEVYSNRDPLDENYRKTCEACLVNILLKPTKEESIVFLLKLASQEIGPNHFLNVMKRIINITEMVMRLHPINIPVTIIIDFGGHTPGHATTFNLSIFRDSIHVLENVFPVRVKQVFLINVAPFVDIIINTLVKPLLKKKTKDRLIVTTQGCETLHKYVDKEVLPKDWHGDYPLTLKEINDIWNEYEIRQCDWYINELSKETDESKRIMTDKNYKGIDPHFGVQGSLKKLVID